MDLFTKPLNFGFFQMISEKIKIFWIMSCNRNLFLGKDIDILAGVISNPTLSKRKNDQLGTLRILYQLATEIGNP
jgi:hypothetical protein